MIIHDFDRRSPYEPNEDDLQKLIDRETVKGGFLERLNNSVNKEVKNERMRYPIDEDLKNFDKNKHPLENHLN